VRTRIFQVWMLLPILTLCAVLSAATTPTGPKETEKTPVYNVDGISIGMTEDEVREIWGPMKQYDTSDGIRYLGRPESFSPLRQMVMLRESQVVKIHGQRLKLGDKLVLGPEHGLEDVENLLGGPAEPRGSICGNPGPFRKVIRAEGNLVFELTGWNLDQLEWPEEKTLQQVLEEHPEYARTLVISIQDRNFYYRHTRPRK